MSYNWGQLTPVYSSLSPFMDLTPMFEYANAFYRLQRQARIRRYLSHRRYMRRLRKWQREHPLTIEYRTPTDAELERYSAEAKAFLQECPTVIVDIKWKAS